MCKRAKNCSASALVFYCTSFVYCLDKQYCTVVYFKSKTQKNTRKRWGGGLVKGQSQQVP